MNSNFQLPIILCGSKTANIYEKNCTVYKKLCRVTSWLKIQLEGARESAYLCQVNFCRHCFFEKLLWGHVQTVPGNMRAKFEVCSFNYSGAISWLWPRPLITSRGRYCLHCVYVGGILWICLQSDIATVRCSSYWCWYVVNLSAKRRCRSESYWCWYISVICDWVNTCSVWMFLYHCCVSNIIPCVCVCVCGYQSFEVGSRNLTDEYLEAIDYVYKEVYLPETRCVNIDFCSAVWCVKWRQVTFNELLTIMRLLATL